MQEFTPDQIEAMRQVVSDSDRSKQPNVFDLSKPPMVPYKFQKFPQMVYDHKKSRPSRYKTYKTAQGEERHDFIPVKYATKMAKNDAELKSLLAQGYEENPPVFDDPTEPDEAAYEAEFSASDIAELDSEPTDAPRRGRPRKEVTA